MDNLLMTSVVGASLVIAGVVVKNSEEQLSRPPSLLGPILFLVGWAVFAYAVANNAVNNVDGKLLPFGAAGLIAVSVVAMKAQMDGTLPISVPKGLLQAGFVVGWFLLAYSLGRKQNIAFASAVLVIISMMFVLPKQRAMNVVDGPGMPLFTAAWAGMIYANALG